MKHEIIYTEHYALIVSDEEVVEGDTLFCTEIKNLMIGGITAGQIRYLDSEIFKKIIAHRPLTDVPILEGVPLLPEFSQEDDVEDLALEYTSSKGNVNPEGYSDKQVGLLHGFIDGYNKAKETYKYTEEDLRKAMYFSTHGEYGKEKTTIGFIQSLKQPKRPNYFECETEKVWVRNTDRNAPTLDDFDTIVKTNTNSQGQTELLGRYIF
jgi:hypothetical protein